MHLLPTQHQNASLPFHFSPRLVIESSRTKSQIDQRPDSTSLPVHLLILPFLSLCRESQHIQPPPYSSPAPLLSSASTYPPLPLLAHVLSSQAEFRSWRSPSPSIVVRALPLRPTSSPSLLVPPSFLSLILFFHELPPSLPLSVLYLTFRILLLPFLSSPLSTSQ